jgi:sporulation protein YlmC with PRC-barrel domain
MTSLDNRESDSGRLIAASQIRGATVYNAALEELGVLDDIVIDKADSRIAYAVVTIGGLLGMRHTYYPLPWQKLRHDSEMGGYIVDVERDVLRGGPSYTDRAGGSWHDGSWVQAIDAYYSTPHGQNGAL